MALFSGGTWKWTILSTIIGTEQQTFHWWCLRTRTMPVVRRDFCLDILLLVLSEFSLFGYCDWCRRRSACANRRQFFTTRLAESFDINLTPVELGVSWFTDHCLWLTPLYFQLVRLDVTSEISILFRLSNENQFFNFVSELVTKMTNICLCPLVHDFHLFGWEKCV